MAQKKIAIAIDPDLLKRADKAAAQLGLSRSAFFERAIEETLEATEALADALGNRAVRDAFMDALKQPGVLRELGEAMGLKLSVKEIGGARALLDEMSDEGKGKKARKGR